VSTFVSIRQLHDVVAWIMTIANGVAGAWTLGAHWWAPLRCRGQWWLVVAAQVTVGVQVLLGVYLQVVQDVSAPGIHVFYGFVTLITVALLFAYREQLRANLYLLYGFGGLFLMGLGIRGMIIA